MVPERSHDLRGITQSQKNHMVPEGSHDPRGITWSQKSHMVLEESHGPRGGTGSQISRLSFVSLRNASGCMEWKIQHCLF